MSIISKKFQCWSPWDEEFQKNLRIPLPEQHPEQIWGRPWEGMTKSLKLPQLQQRPQEVVPMSPKLPHTQTLVVNTMLTDLPQIQQLEYPQARESKWIQISMPPNEKLQIKLILILLDCAGLLAQGLLHRRKTGHTRGFPREYLVPQGWYLPLTYQRFYW